jgi:hypothetical protein
MPLLIIITITNTSKTVLIIYSLVLFKAKLIFKEIHNFINKFIFYNIPSLKDYINN